MRWLLLAIIRMYWLIPKSKRRTCLFKKSCSHYVYDATKLHGLQKGLECLRYRFKNCRQGYILYKNIYAGRFEMILPNKDILFEEEIAEKLLAIAEQNNI